MFRRNKFRRQTNWRLFLFAQRLSAKRIPPKNFRPTKFRPIFFGYRNPYKKLVFFYIFWLFGMNPYPDPYSLWCSCENRQSYTSTHFCDVAKKSLPSTIVYDILTRAAPKNLPKKVLKKAFRRAWISDCDIELHLFKKSRKKCKTSF